MKGFQGGQGGQWFLLRECPNPRSTFAYFGGCDFKFGLCALDGSLRMTGLASGRISGTCWPRAVRKEVEKEIAGLSKRRPLALPTKLRPDLFQRSPPCSRRVLQPVTEFRSSTFL